MGQLRPQPRRVDARQARRAGTRGRVPGVCAGGACASTNAGSVGDCRRCSRSDQARIELAYSLLFTLPGTPALLWGGDRAFGRPRARWQGGGANADAMGQRAQRWFLVGTGSASRLTRPGRRPVRSTRRNRVSASRSGVAAQLDGADDPPAQECHEIGWGTPTRLSTGEGCVFAHRYDWEGRALLFAHNLAFEPRWSSCETVSRTSRWLEDACLNGEQVEPRERGRRSSSTPRDTGGSRSCSATGDGRIER